MKVNELHQIGSGHFSQFWMGLILRISDVFIPCIKADCDDTQSRLRIGTKILVISLERTYFSEQEKNKLVHVHLDLVSNLASPVSKARKIPTAPPHQLIQIRWYYEKYSEINQIQSEVDNSI